MVSIELDLGERLIRWADRVLSENTGETIGHTGGITNVTATDTSVPTTKAVKEYIDGHEHGNISNDGKIGSVANKPVITTTNGTLTTSEFGADQNTFCEGNDSRLSDARTPKPHSHSNYISFSDIQDNLSSTATNKPLSAKQGKELKTMITNIVHCQIIPSTYNPKIGDKIDIEFVAKNGENNGIEVTDNLIINSTKYNNVDKYSIFNNIEITTDNNGTFTLTGFPILAWGIIDLEWNGVHCQLYSSGWLERGNDNDNVSNIGSGQRSWYLMRNETSARLVLNNWVNPSSATSNNWNDFGGHAYAAKMRPKGAFIGMNSLLTTYFIILSTSGWIRYKSMSGTLSANTTHNCVIEWTIQEDDVNNYKILHTTNGVPYLEP